VHPRQWSGAGSHIEYGRDQQESGVGSMRKFFGSMGSLSRVAVESQALKSNMLGDPPVRVVDVYLPAGYDGEG
jgi:hypothetical protein